MISSLAVSIRVPVRLFHQGTAAKLVAQAENGYFGVLPAHVDFATALVPSVLVLTMPDGNERVFGIDEGVLVKHGDQVNICVRRAVQGDDMAHLRSIVHESFVEMDEHERTARAALSRLEANMVRRFAELKDLR